MTKASIRLCLPLLIAAAAGSLAKDAKNPPEESPEPLLRDSSRMDVVENFRLPLEKHPDGRVKTLLNAKRAGMKPDGTVAAEQIRIEMYAATGALAGVLRAEDADIDQVNGRGSGKGDVLLERQGVKISGTGLTWIGRDSIVRIESNAVVELDRSGKTLAEGWR